MASKVEIEALAVVVKARISREGHSLIMHDAQSLHPYRGIL